MAQYQLVMINYDAKKRGIFPQKNGSKQGFGGQIME